MEAPKKVKVARARKSNSAVAPEASSASATVSASSHITLPADLRIGSAATVHAELSGSPADQAMVIDASAVAKVDAAGVQAILAGLLKRQAAGNWSWAAPSEPFLRAVRVLGLQDAMALPAK